MSELVEKAKASLAKHGEVMVKGVIEDIYEPAVLEAKEAAKKLIPGTIDDAVIELVVTSFSPALKAGLLAQVDKLSAEV